VRASMCLLQFFFSFPKEKKKKKTIIVFFLYIVIPAPVAPEQGTALSTTATERSEETRKWRAMVKPMTPAPTTTTSYA